MSSEPSPSLEPAHEEAPLELFQPPKPAISKHTGGLPDMDMRTTGGIGEEKKRVCGKCADCLACTRKKAEE